MFMEYCKGTVVLWLLRFAVFSTAYQLLMHFTADAWIWLNLRLFFWRSSGGNYLSWQGI